MENVRNFSPHERDWDLLVAKINATHGENQTPSTSLPTEFRHLQESIGYGRIIYAEHTDLFDLSVLREALCVWGPAEKFARLILTAGYTKTFTGADGDEMKEKTPFAAVSFALMKDTSMAVKAERLAERLVMTLSGKIPPHESIKDELARALKLSDKAFVAFKGLRWKVFGHIGKPLEHRNERLWPEGINGVDERGIPKWLTHVDTPLRKAKKTP